MTFVMGPDEQRSLAIDTGEEGAKIDTRHQPAFVVSIEAVMTQSFPVLITARATVEGIPIPCDSHGAVGLPIKEAATLTVFIQRKDVRDVQSAIVLTGILVFIVGIITGFNSLMQEAITATRCNAIGQAAITVEGIAIIAVLFVEVMKTITTTGIDAAIDTGIIIPTIPIIAVFEIRALWLKITA